MADWSLPREDLAARARGGLRPPGSRPGESGPGESRLEGFRPPPHERARGPAARLRVALRRGVDLQFGSIWHDLSWLLPQVRGTLADVGCGAQPFRDLLRPEVRYVGVDIEDAQGRFGRRAPRDGGGGSTPGEGAPGEGAPGEGAADTRYFSGDLLPLADGEADTVLCTETLEHVLDTASFLRELRRALASGGRLILTVPFAARWHFVPQDYWRFTPAGLEHVLTQAGFCEVRIYARGGALAVAGYKVLGLVVLLLAGQGREGAAGTLSRLAGLCLLPVAAVGALLGNLGLKFPGTAEDTLGYTVVARTGPALRDSALRGPKSA